jgi:hypothetical protein
MQLVKNISNESAVCELIGQGFSSNAAEYIIEELESAYGADEIVEFHAYDLNIQWCEYSLEELIHDYYNSDCDITDLVDEDDYDFDQEEFDSLSTGWGDTLQSVTKQVIDRSCAVELNNGNYLVAN